MTTSPDTDRRARLAVALLDAREHTRGVSAHLQADEPVFPRRATLNPARWVLGHVAWFQEYWCLRHGAATTPGDPAGSAVASRLPGADALYDTARVPHGDRWSIPLPDWRGTWRYLDETLAATLVELDRCDADALDFAELALLHEDMHGEALLMTLQQLGLPPPSGWTLPAPEAFPGQAGDLVVAGGRHVIGRSPDDARTRFAFDNEHGAHEVEIAPFAIARACVTEGEFAAFVDEGGYAQSSLWTDEGWRWLASSRRSMPATWRRADGYEVRWFDRWRALAPDRAIQHVNAYEAEAWCRWAARRLPTEAEWEVAAALAGDDPGRANLDAKHRGPGAPDPSPRFLGDVWEWTSSAFLPYPGFVPGPYAEYSLPWFGDHRVLRGGSWATRARLVHARFRNFYRPRRDDMFVGFRTCAAG